MNRWIYLRFSAQCLASGLVLHGCDDGDRKSEAVNAAAMQQAVTVPDQPVIVSAENLAIITLQEISDGPTIAGSLTPESESVIRSEAAGSVLEVLAEQGQPVTRGQLLARIEDTGLQDQVHSARAALRSSEQLEQVAARNLERVTRLAAAGAIAEREVESARVNVSNAAAQVAEAVARVAMIEKQVAKTRIHAPIDGVVSLRPVNGGDVVSVGSALFSIVDPRRMQLIAAVPAAWIAAILPGAPVRFRVQGYPDRKFDGIVSRISPAADPATRQVLIYVKVPNVTGSLIGGLFAEGKVGTETRQTFTAPTSAVDLSSGKPSVGRIRNGRVQRIEVRTGIRDERSDRVELIGDIEVGDTLLLGAAQSIPAGALVHVQSVDTPARR